MMSHLLHKRKEYELGKPHKRLSAHSLQSTLALSAEETMNQCALIQTKQANIKGKEAQIIHIQYVVIMGNL